MPPLSVYGDFLNIPNAHGCVLFVGLGDWAERRRLWVSLDTLAIPNCIVKDSAFLL